jgi:hypothetical protein
MKRLVHYEHPGAIDTPMLLLGELREIDPTVELVHAGQNRWWLGGVNDNAERRARAEMMMMQLEIAERTILASNELAVDRKLSPRTVMLCKLNLQGFSLIETYFGNDPAGTVYVEDGEHSYECSMVEDFRERTAHWERDRGSRIVKEKLLRTMREPERREAEARRLEWLYTDGRDQYRRHMRNRVSAMGADIGERAARSGLILPSESLILTP